MGDIGVVTEQGYVAGEFGFSPLTEADKENVNKTTSNNEDQKSDNK